MSTAVTERPNPEVSRSGLRADLGPVSPIPLSRLARIELRKMVDTTAGRWFVASIGLVVLAVVAIIFFVDGDSVSFAGYLQGTVTPLSILLPILGIMGVTAEWGQRTAMTTFALEPRRGRIVAAKIIASMVMGVFAFAVAVGLAALMNWLSTMLMGASGDWEVSSWLVGGAALFLAFSLGQGLAFGMILLNTPAAIVTYFVLPMVWSILTSLISGLQTTAEWLDPSRTMSPLVMGTALDGQEWAQLATSMVVWLVLPLAAGTVRVLKREVK